MSDTSLTASTLEGSNISSARAAVSALTEARTAVREGRSPVSRSGETATEGTTTTRVIDFRESAAPAALAKPQRAQKISATASEAPAKKNGGENKKKPRNEDGSGPNGTTTPVHINDIRASISATFEATGNMPTANLHSVAFGPLAINKLRKPEKGVGPGWKWATLDSLLECNLVEGLDEATTLDEVVANTLKRDLKGVQSGPSASGEATTPAVASPALGVTKYDVVTTFKAYEEANESPMHTGLIKHGPLTGRMDFLTLNRMLIAGDVEGIPEDTGIGELIRDMEECPQRYVVTAPEAGEREARTQHILTSTKARAEHTSTTLRNQRARRAEEAADAISQFRRDELVSAAKTPRGQRAKPAFTLTSGPETAVKPPSSTKPVGLDTVIGSVRPAKAPEPLVA